MARIDIERLFQLFELLGVTTNETGYLKLKFQTDAQLLRFIRIKILFFQAIRT